MKNIAVIVGAGKGKRMGSKDKAFLDFNRKPVLLYSITPFELSPLVDEIILVVGNNKVKAAENLIKKYRVKKVTGVITGGKERQDSVHNALKIIKNANLVLVHDVARPFIDTRLIKTCVIAAKKFKAAIPAVLSRDTVKRGNSFVEKTIPRNNLWLIQTPQVFDFSILKKAYDTAIKKKFCGTDDASLVERLGYKIKIVQGYSDNIKITFSSDLIIAEALLKKRERE